MSVILYESQTTLAGTINTFTHSSTQTSSGMSPCDLPVCPMVDESTSCEGNAPDFFDAENNPMATTKVLVLDLNDIEFIGGQYNKTCNGLTQVSGFTIDLRFDSETRELVSQSGKDPAGVPIYQRLTPIEP